jgi:hypothetical protein
MKRQKLVDIAALLLTVAASLSAALSEQERNDIDRLAGTKGAWTAAENVHKVSFPRTDLKVVVDGTPLHPFMGLTSWAAFTGGGDHVMVMGDLALVEDEVNAVMSVALENGLEVTALHNHFFFDRPRAMFMHIGGMGSAEKLAASVRQCIDKIADIRKMAPEPATSFRGLNIPAKSSITPAPLEQILGVKGQANNGMYKVSIGRAAKAHGHPIGNQMGVNTWAAFAGSDERALVDGDFAMLTSELQNVLKTLRRAGINIVAIHNHMTHEQPQYVFLHYWGTGRAADLAKAVKAAADTQNR